MNTKLVYGLGAAVVAAIAVFMLQSNDQPDPQGHSMTPPDTTILAQGDPIATVVLPAVLSGDAQIGKRGKNI